MSSISRFGASTSADISLEILKSIPKNTKHSKTSIWKQFTAFCKEKEYELLQDTPTEVLSNILKDWAFNMKKRNGEDYKEYVVKTMWNSTAKMLQEKYYQEFGIIIEPFNDIIYNNCTFNNCSF